MKRRLFLYTTLIISLGLLGFFAASIYVTHNNNLSIAKDTVMETTRICVGLYEDDDDLELFVKASREVRITVIAPDGTVLADSSPLDIDMTENHLNRPEVKAAAKGEPETFVRHSETLGVDLIYYALMAESGESFVFIRTAIPVAKIDVYLLQSLPLLIFVLVFIAILCFYLSRSMIASIMKPFETIKRKLRLLSSGDYEPEPFALSYEEVNAITKEIDVLAQVLHDSYCSLRDEKGKVEYLLNNISDGIFAVDENKNIVLINAAALNIFDVSIDITDKNMNYLCYDLALLAAVDDCIMQEKSSLFEASFNGRVYLITVKRLTETAFTMVVLSDVTDSRENAKRREEFFANASHGLKTPLTAIKGFTELTAINNKDKNISKYIESISRETERMLSLIGDMLELSELENAQKNNPVAVSLAQVANEVCETLSAAIAEKALSLEIIGDGVIQADPSHVYELVKNLVENAVQYNNTDGMISIVIEDDAKNTWLTVYDDGIGISPDEQTRIFERFYRVERSRSTRGGGTGLGLAIVKHICALYGWELLLKSKPGVGTEIKVTFAKK
ncbi:MAG: ATP-binding protein [Eggerthellaceae bacterium]|nr:ATP-binding protein [Eggerthellaceae bacterium]